MIAKICKAPGCYLMAENGSKYCKKHEAYQEYYYNKAVSKPYQNAERPNEGLYRSYRWKQLRAKIIKAHPFCSVCSSTDNLSVHHIVPPKGDEALFFDENNLVVLCMKCHNKETNYEVNQLRKR